MTLSGASAAAGFALDLQSHPPLIMLLISAAVKSSPPRSLEGWSSASALINGTATLQRINCHEYDKGGAVFNILKLYDFLVTILYHP